MKLLLPALALIFLMTPHDTFAGAPQPKPGVVTKRKMHQTALTLVGKMDQGGAMKQQISSIIEQQTASLQELPCASNAIPKVRSLLEKALNPDVMRDAMADVYVNNFTLDELEWMLDFYNTKLGMKLLEVQPAVYRAVSNVSNERMKAIEGEITAAVGTATKDSKCQMQLQRNR